MSKISLDLREIVGEITDDTPIFVLIYIGTFLKLQYKPIHYQANYHYTDIVNQILVATWPEINELNFDSEESELKRVIKFVSPYSSSSEWYNDTIIEAYNNLMSYKLTNQLPDLKNTTLIFGNKSHVNPTKLNEVIVFRIIKSLGYSYDRNTTFTECCNFIKRYYEGNINSMRNSLINTIRGLSDVDLLKIYNYTVSYGSKTSSPTEQSNVNIQTEQRFTFDETKMLFTITEFTDKRKIITKILPLTHYEAIIVCALKYDIDVSTSSNPLKEYEALTKKNYIPYCPDFSRRLSLNRKYYTVSKNWSLNILNNQIYTEDSLKYFVIEEGCLKSNDMSYRDMVAFLKATKKMTNFTIGVNPNCNENTTLMLTPIESVNKDELICIGIEDEETKQRLYSQIENSIAKRNARMLDKHKMTYITLEELGKFWQLEKIFTSPFSGERLDPIVINKLKNYCNKIVFEKNSSSPSARFLLSVIDELNVISELLDSKLISLKSKIKNISDNDVKENVKFFFNKCLEFSLYLRGWKLNSEDYPLDGDKMRYDPSMILPRSKIPNNEIYNGIDYTAHQFVMDHSYIAYEEAINILNEIPEELAMDIRSLYTLKFSNNINQRELMGMIVSDVKINYKETLLECMNNIFGGLKNIESCMNTNSNWIMFSSIWYMTILEFPTPFLLSDIKTVY